MTEESGHVFRVTATWSPEEKKGEIASDSALLAVPHAGATALGGTGAATNPEELIAAALSSCFVQTWTIFIQKLKVPIEHPVVRVTCTVEKDPAGGFHITRLDVAPQVPAALWNERRADVEKTLQLAEKYCIVSKAVRADGSVLRVAPDVA